MNSTPTDLLVPEVHRILENTGPAGAKLLQALDTILERLGCTVGMIHALDVAAQILDLRAHRGIPGSILERVRRVPVGKWKLVARSRGEWELYDLDLDRTESRDLAKENPARVAELAAKYSRWAERCGVLPWNEVRESQPAEKPKRP